MRVYVFDYPNKIENSTNEHLIFIRDNLNKVYINFDWNDVESNKDGTIAEQYKFELLKRCLLVCPKERDKKINEILKNK